jgi:arylsulfatase A-like enzyme
VDLCSSTAAEGVLFRRAYGSVPTCGPSRASLLTGLYPTRSRFAEYDTRADEDAPEAVTLPQHFKQQGYYTAGLGKVFHTTSDSPESWSKAPWHPNQDPDRASPTWRSYKVPEHVRMNTTGPERGSPYESAAVSDTAYYEGMIARRTARDPKRLDG